MQSNGVTRLKGAAKKRLCDVQAQLKGRSGRKLILQCRWSNGINVTAAVLQVPRQTFNQIKESPPSSPSQLPQIQATPKVSLGTTSDMIGWAARLRFTLIQKAHVGFAVGSDQFFKSRSTFRLKTVVYQHLNTSVVSPLKQKMSGHVHQKMTDAVVKYRLRGEREKKNKIDAKAFFVS